MLDRICAEKIKNDGHIGLKAVLKHTQSKRCRDCRAGLNFAKRLDCGGLPLLSPGSSR